jgi:hypothetical protein
MATFSIPTKNIFVTLCQSIVIIIIIIIIIFLRKNHNIIKQLIDELQE